MILLVVNLFILFMLDLIMLVWLCFVNVVVYIMIRMGGISIGDFVGLNVGVYVGDDFLLVKVNRSLILYSEKIIWLE